VIGNAAATERESRLSKEKVLKVTATVHAGTGRSQWIGAGREEEQLSVKRLRKVLVQRDAIILSAKTKKMLAGRITGSVEECEVVL